MVTFKQWLEAIHPDGDYHDEESIFFREPAFFSKSKEQSRRTSLFDPDATGIYIPKKEVDPNIEQRLERIEQRLSRIEKMFKGGSSRRSA